MDSSTFIICRTGDPGENYWAGGKEETGKGLLLVGNLRTSTFSVFKFFTETWTSGKYLTMVPSLFFCFIKNLGIPNQNRCPFWKFQTLPLLNTNAVTQVTVCDLDIKFSPHTSCVTWTCCVTGSCRDLNPHLY